MKKLRISDGISLPLDLATQTVAVLARKRVGKTYTASVMAEELIEAGIPIVVLDPTGAWWGLRSSADGKSEGYPVVIIGGAHADVPLEERAGKIIADLVVDHPGYYVIDFSQLESDASVRRFAEDFGARFYFRKEEKRFPIHLIIDEADVFCPQQPFADQKKLVHVYDVIVRRGGIRGIGVTMISQRPAVLNKNILTQCETLITLQISGSQDVDAIEHWIRLHGTKEERDEFLGSIASLKRGEAWIWSPSWLEVFEKVNIRERKTFNSSATPKAGEKIIVPQKLAPVDIAKLGDQIRLAAERVKENDPAELRKQIAELRKMASAPPPEPAVEIKEVSVFTKDDISTLQCLNADLKVVKNFAESLDRRLTEIMAKQCHNNGVRMPQLPAREVRWDKEPRVFLEKRDEPKIRIESEVAEEFGKAERMILNVLGAHRRASRKKIAVCAGYAVTGGSFNNALGKLRSLGLITRGEPIALTEAGGNVAPNLGLPTGENLFRMWIDHPNLGKAERMILQVLWEHLGASLPKEKIAEACGYEPTGGSFNNALGRLRTLELINRGSPIALAEEFSL